MICFYEGGAKGTEHRGTIQWCYIMRHRTGSEHFWTWYAKMAVGDGRTDDHSEASSIQTTSSVNLSGGNGGGGGDRALSTNPAYVAGYVGGGQPNGVTGPSSQGFFSFPSSPSTMRTNHGQKSAASLAGVYNVNGRFPRRDKSNWSSVGGDQGNAGVGGGMGNGGVTAGGGGGDGGVSMSRPAYVGGSPVIRVSQMTPTTSGAATDQTSVTEDVGARTLVEGSCGMPISVSGADLQVSKVNRVRRFNLGSDNWW